ncbi:MAG: 5-formyltetrahydrofolate cyclo-ligase, partial [Desulfobacteraceae bacterium]
KQELRKHIEKKLASLSENELLKNNKAIEQRLFEFANFLEARIVLFYLNFGCEVDTLNIIKKSYEYNKIIVIPVFNQSNNKFKLMKIDNIESDLLEGPHGNKEPDPKKCKVVPIECIDIAIIPGIAMDEKGGRVGPGNGFYDRLIPELPVTTRKVGLAMESQVIPQVPMESHDKYVDIVITEKRVIYKI